MNAPSFSLGEQCTNGEHLRSIDEARNPILADVVTRDGEHKNLDTSNVVMTRHLPTAVIVLSLRLPGVPETM